MRPIRKRLSNKTMTLIGIPKEKQKLEIYDMFDYGDVNRRKAIKALQEYASNLPAMFNQGRGIFLFGSNGTGKTTIASIILKEAYRHRYTALRITFSNYVDKYTEHWNCKDYAEKQLLLEGIRNIKSKEFLVIEEIGKELSTELSPVVLEDLLRYREDNNLPTIICTNLDIKAFKHKYGNSIVSLIKGSLRPIQLSGVDRRFEK